MHTSPWIGALAAFAIAGVATLSPGPADALTPFTLYWTAPGDDSLSGRATVYDLRYSPLPITPINFALATPVLGEPSPGNAGTTESMLVTGLPEVVPLYFAMRTADEAGNWSGVSNVLLRPGQTTDTPEAAVALSFSSPWPNPARESVRWSYALPQAARMQVEVVDVTGRHVHTVAAGERLAGRGELIWDLRDSSGRPVGAGLYFVKARLGTLVWTRRLVVVR